MDELFFQKLIFSTTNWDREIKGKKDKAIIALTDRSHIKAPLLGLLATLCRKKGTKETKRRENDKPADLLLFHKWKSLVITC